MNLHEHYFQKLLKAIFFAGIFSVAFLNCAPQKSIEKLKPLIQKGLFIDLPTVLKEKGYSETDIIRADKNMRVNVATSIREALLNQYSLVHLKEKRIQTADRKPFNTEAHLNYCVEVEKQTDDLNDLHFLDRLRQCIAGFQDTHLHVKGRVEVPTVSAGILVRKIEGKYYIARRHRDLLNFLKAISDDSDFNEVTAIGNEVVSIDGKTPEELVKHYAKFVSASSDTYRQVIAEQSIFHRDFDYPVKNYVDIVVKSDKLEKEKTWHYKLPWFASENTKLRADARAYFNQLNIPVTPKVATIDPKTHEVSEHALTFEYEGYKDNSAIQKADSYLPLSEYFGNDDKKSEDKTPAARMGVMSYDGQNFCYLELLTFAPKNLVPQSSRQTSKGYVETVKDFVKFCKSRQFDLVMDLRQNNGGNGHYPARILSLIAKPDSHLGGKVYAFRANQTSARLASSLVEQPEYNIGDLTDIDVRSVEEIHKAISAGQLMTGVIPVQEEITPDSDIGGFPGKVIALITPRCVSACDGMSALLKRSGRGVLIGTHTNGTGAGFMASDTLSSVYHDSYLEITMKIPNYQFGYSSHPFSSLDTLDFDKHADEYFTENRPTYADILIETTFSDILNHNKADHANSWLNAVVAELKK